jgi:cell division protease FtsH
MSLREHTIDHARCLELAAEMLGGPVRALQLDWELQSMLRRRLRLQERRALAGTSAMLMFRAQRPGHELIIGAEAYRVIGADGLRLVKLIAPRGCEEMDQAYEFWAVAERNYRRLYALLRRTVRKNQRQPPPLLPAADQRRLWQNSIGFLKQTQHRLREFGVAAKRGILLLGEPGNGKTMACRWLRGLCNRTGLSWQSVTAEQFDACRRNGKAHELFELECPGIVFFDDVDMAVRDRNSSANVGEASTFLSGLDGLDLHHGVVYIFTTNATIPQLDPAFLRPGRIDLSLEFKRPSATMRRRFIVEHWHSDIVGELDLESAVAQTDGLSFAELDEVKRLMVLDFLTTTEWGWSRAWAEFRRGRGQSERSPIGFASSTRVGAAPATV